jgi:hypothetical protein
MYLILKCILATKELQERKKRLTRKEIKMTRKEKNKQKG